MKKIYILAGILLIVIKSFSQSITVGSYAEEMARINQICGESENASSFVIRPINTLSFTNADTVLQSLTASKNLYHGTGSFVVKALPLSLLTEYDAKRPFGYDNGSLYPNAGLQNRLSAGIYLKSGIFQIQLKPELVYAENKDFKTFADVQANNNSAALLNAYYEFAVNGIDAPERFGNSSITHFYPGQSKIIITYKNVEAGVSTENLWWGPGIQNAIMISNSAPGFLHWTLNSAKPVQTKIGAFEWQIIGGNLKQSGYLPLDTNKLVYGKGLFIPKPEVSRYISAFTINWQPKWIEGLYLGATSYDYMDKDSSYKAHNIFHKIIPVITGSSGSANAITNTNAGDSQDFAYAINVRQVLPKYNAELYFEWARNDRAANLNDFLQEPEHSSAYTIGGRRLFEVAEKQFFQVKFELTHLEKSPTYLLRDEPSWYVHLQSPRDGYTNDGRYVGAGIGPGSNSLMFDFSLLNHLNSYGMTMERLVHDNDLYYQAFAGTGIFNRQWVDFSDTFYANFKLKKYMISASLSPVYSLNYEYAGGSGFNLHAAVNLTYCFN